MEHTLEPAVSNRAKCRGCGKTIEKGTLRLGERLPNPFSDRTPMTLWFHPDCAAYKRPETFLEVLEEYPDTLEDAASLKSIAESGAEHRRLPRITGVERAPSARASCRECRETIAKGEWRIKLVYFEDGRFNPAGYLHPGCASAYFETANIIDRIRYFAEDTTESDLDEISTLLR